MCFSLVLSCSIWARQLKCPRHLASSNKFFLATSVCHVCRHSAASSKALITATGSSPFTWSCSALASRSSHAFISFYVNLCYIRLGSRAVSSLHAYRSTCNNANTIVRTLSHMCRHQTWSTAIESGHDIMCKSGEKPCANKNWFVWCSSMDSLSPSPSPPVQPMGRWLKARATG